MELAKLFRTKPLNEFNHKATNLRRCLNAFDLTLLGIGAIIGAGIFVLTGIAAATRAGPAVVLSFACGGIVSAISALSYAELAASIGGCGSAYGYAFAGLGELVAWIIGWDLLLEYGLCCSTVAIGWSGYVYNALYAAGVHIPTVLTKDPFEGGIINLPAVVIILAVMTLLAIGVRTSAKFNKWIVFIKIAVIALFIVIAFDNFKISNWQPFLPFGWQGIFNGAALIFFAYIGFDAVSTAAEEAIHPERDLPIGIICSLAVCTLIFMSVSGLLTGIVKYTTLNVSSPISDALITIGYRAYAGIIAVGAIAGLTTVILVMYYGFTRIFLAMSRDGLLPAVLAVVNPKSQTPVRIIILVGLMMSLIAGFMPIRRLAELVNIGTLAAFTLVCLGVIIMRRTKPDMPRPFKAPFSPFLPALGVLFCLYLMFSLPKTTWIAFLIWTTSGLFIYFLYSRTRSVLAGKK